MSWFAVIVLAIGAYGCKAIGLIALGTRPVGPKTAQAIALVPAALLTSLIVVQTIGDGQALILDARLAGVASGALVAWRGRPFVLVLIVAATVTAGFRWIGIG